ncbi:MAG: MFS transporter [Gemmataceae bacterium]|nr:MFS transporter [Gemmataceae bacterium]
MSSPSRRALVFTLLVLLGINTMNFYDRQVLGAVGEIVKNKWELSDTQLSALTTAFILLYAAVGIPLGLWADVGRRKLILAIGVLVWSAMTALSGTAENFTVLFAYRLGVGVGEASCAPAANSLLGDLFPAQARGRAIAVFMLGLPLGLGLSYIISGEIVAALDWRAALFVAGAPGLLLGILALWLPEPSRGAAESPLTANPSPPQERGEKTVSELTTQAGSREFTSEGGPVWTVLRIPTMWWIIASGALQNLAMYALGMFLTSFFMRYHGLDIKEANWISGVAYGLGGGIGMLGGGWLCDRAQKRGVAGRLLVGAFAMALSAPCMWLALQMPQGDYFAFAAFLLPACVCIYIYYPAVYATIQDIVAPSLRGTAMAVYFFVFYLFAAAGLYGFGWLSDMLAGRAREAGASPTEARALGLHDALYVVPVLLALLVIVLVAATRTVNRDYRKLHNARVE